MTITLILSLLAAVLVALTDFAGWTENTYYGQNDYFVYIGSESAPGYATTILLLILGVHLVSVYSSYIMMSDNPFTKNIGLVANSLALAVTILSAVLFLILAEEAVGAWLDTGFYASLVASGSGIFFFSKMDSQ